jgi:iron complex transport system ATP-binding protein
MSPAVKTINLTVVKGSKKILADVSCEIPRGQMTAVLGMNGAGKTTFLRALCGLEGRLSSVHVDGRSLADFPPKDLARTLTWIPPTPNVVLPFSAAEVVLWGSFGKHLGLGTENDLPAVLEALDVLGIAHLANHRFNMLSTGEQHKVLLSRVFYQQNKVVILDEPFSHLDLVTQIDLIRKLENLCQSQMVTVIASCHDLPLALGNFHHFLGLKKGSLQMSGRRQDLANDAIFKEIFDIDNNNIKYFNL